MTSQKVSFGFSKLAKKNNILSTSNGTDKKTIDYIDCLEGQSIKIKDAVEIVETPLVIPMRETANNLLDRIEEAKRKKKLADTSEAEDTRPDSELTVDELAARQLLREAKETKETNNASEILSLPNVDKFVAEGKEEPTLNDYETVPIAQYGMAMLRGMGWSEKKGIGKNEKVIQIVAPELRARGMGLGADKIMNTVKPERTVDKDGKELMLVKGSFAKIIAGQHKMKYCEVLSFDDESGRIAVKTTLDGKTLTLNEFLLVPVTKDEYDKSSKVINNAKYQEYIEKSEIDKSIKSEKENLSKNVKENPTTSDSVKGFKMKKSKKSKKHKKSNSKTRNSDRKYEDKRSHRHSRKYSNSDSECKSKKSSQDKAKHNKRVSRSRSRSSSEDSYKNRRR